MTFWTRKQKSNIPDALKPWARGPRPFELLTSVPDDMSIPKDWDGMLGLPVEGRVAWINNCLERVVGTQLRETIHYLRSHLVGVDLMREGPDMGILYSIESDSGRTNYWCGGLPLGFGQTGGISTEHYNSSVGGGQLNWSRVPEPLKRLYELHDGFGYYTNGFGFPTTRGMIRLGNEDLGIVETLQLKVEVDLSQTFCFFSNGAGGYLGVDLSDSAQDKAVLWWAKYEPTYNVNFWDVVDEWILMDLSEAE